MIKYVKLCCSLFILSACARSDLAPFEIGSASNIIPVSSRGEIVVGPRGVPDTYVPVEYTPKRKTSYEKPISVVQHPDTAEDLDDIDDDDKKEAAPLKVETKLQKPRKAVEPKIKVPEKITPKAKPTPQNGKIVDNGKIISKFGDIVDGYQSDGVSIKAPLGAPVRSFRNGEVIYAGNKLQEYGNIVVVKHDDGYISTYAHLQKIKVQRGAKVTAGVDTIGLVGKSGNVTTPQVYFQLMKDSQPVNPSNFIKL